MTSILRIMLIIASLLFGTWIIRRICKSQAKIEDSVFWVFFSGILLVMSIFPEIVVWGATFTGVQAPVNFVFLCIIFILIVKIFRVSVKVSLLESKLQELTQKYGIDRLQMEHQKRK